MLTNFKKESTRNWKCRRLDLMFIGIKLIIFPWIYHQFWFSTASEYLHHSNVKFHENGTVTYVPVRRTIPVPELSISDPHKDIITTVNIPLIGLSDVAADLSSIAALGMSTLAQSTHARPFINLTVHDYLWGYQDNLVALANNVLPNIFHFPKLGIMDRVGENICILLSRSLILTTLALFVSI